MAGTLANDSISAPLQFQWQRLTRPRFSSFSLQA